MEYKSSLNSHEIQNAIKWLENEIKFYKKRLKKMLKNKRDKIFKDLVREEIKMRSKIRYLCSDALVFYVLNKANLPLVKEFINAAKEREFWVEEDYFLITRMIYGT